MARLGTALSPDLANTLVLLRGGHQSTAGGDFVGDRLLDVDVLTGLHSPHAAQGMPVVRRGGADDTHIRIRKRFPHVAHVFRGDPLLLRDLPAPILSDLLVDVDNIQHRRTRIAHKCGQVVPATSANTHHGDPQLLVRTLPPADVRTDRNGSGGRQGTTQESTSREPRHRILLVLDHRRMRQW